MLGGAEGGSGVRALRDDPLTKTPSVGTLPFFVRVWEVPPSLPRTVPPVQHGWQLSPGPRVAPRVG
uniref:Uncharacterized protein n=1 Tax=Oryza barthii TaxID=65489 RepID=A0A0D3ELP3_9ORYZ